MGKTRESSLLFQLAGVLCGSESTAIHGLEVLQHLVGNSEKLEEEERKDRAQDLSCRSCQSSFRHTQDSRAIMADLVYTDGSNGNGIKDCAELLGYLKTQP